MQYVLFHGKINPALSIRVYVENLKWLLLLHLGLHSQYEPDAKLIVTKYLVHNSTFTEHFIYILSLWLLMLDSIVRSGVQREEDLPPGKDSLVC